MTTNLGEIFNDVLFRSGKDKRGGYLTPQQFNIAITTINQRKMNALVDGFEVTKEVTSDLEPFIKTYGSPQFPALTLTPVVANDTTKGGYVNVPDDYWYHARSYYMSYLNVDCGSSAVYTPVEFVSQHIADAKLASSIESPVLNWGEFGVYPIAFFQNNKIFVYPNINRFSLTIIREPVQPVFDYDIISGMWVYLPPGETHVNSSVLPAGTLSQSVEFEYPESCVDELTQMITEQFALANENKWNIDVSPKVK